MFLQAIFCLITINLVRDYLLFWLQISLRSSVFIQCNSSLVPCIWTVSEYLQIFFPPLLSVTWTLVWCFLPHVSVCTIHCVSYRILACSYLSQIRLLQVLISKSKAWWLKHDFLKSRSKLSLLVGITHMLPFTYFSAWSFPFVRFY